MVNLLKMLQATVSHDMISPLNLINMYGSLLEGMPQFNQPESTDKRCKKKGKFSTDAKSLLKQIQNASKFAQMKFKDLLDVSLLDNRSFVLRESRFVVRTIIEEVCELMEAQAKAQKLTIDLNLD